MPGDVYKSRKPSPSQKVALHEVNLKPGRGICALTAVRCAIMAPPVGGQRLLGWGSVFSDLVQDLVHECPTEY